MSLWGETVGRELPSHRLQGRQVLTSTGLGLLASELLLAGGVYSQSTGRVSMNWSQIEGEWKQVKAQVKSKWAKLNDDDLKNLSAKKDDLVGKLQERYGILKDEAERQVDAFTSSLGADRTSAHSSPGQKMSK
jgi:uncharacterized protein YjbJ (UPF0337 family)